MLQTKHEANGNGFVGSIGFLHRERVCVSEPHLDVFRLRFFIRFFSFRKKDLPVTYTNGRF